MLPSDKRKCVSFNKVMVTGCSAPHKPKTLPDSVLRRFNAINSAISSLQAMVFDLRLSLTEGTNDAYTWLSSSVVNVYFCCLDGPFVCWVRWMKFMIVSKKSRGLSTLSTETKTSCAISKDLATCTRQPAAVTKLLKYFYLCALCLLLMSIFICLQLIFFNFAYIFILCNNILSQAYNLWLDAASLNSPGFHPQVVPTTFQMLPLRNWNWGILQNEIRYFWCFWPVFEK